MILILMMNLGFDGTIDTSKKTGFANELADDLEGISGFGSSGT